jgi:hypothetical protein
LVGSIKGDGQNFRPNTYPGVGNGDSRQLRGMIESPGCGDLNPEPHRINRDPRQAGESLPQLARRGKNRRSIPNRVAFRGHACSNRESAIKLPNRFQYRRNFGQYRAPGLAIETRKFAC